MSQRAQSMCAWQRCIYSCLAPFQGGNLDSNCTKAKPLIPVKQNQLFMTSPRPSSLCVDATTHPPLVCVTVHLKSMAFKCRKHSISSPPPIQGSLVCTTVLTDSLTLSDEVAEEKERSQSPFIYMIIQLTCVAVCANQRSNRGQGTFCVLLLNPSRLVKVR